MKSTSACLAAFVALAASAAASPVRFTATAHVERNDFTAGTFFGVPDDVHTGAGAPVKLTIMVDSDNYINSAAYPTRVRAYTFGVNDLSLDAGAVHAVLRSDRTLNYLCLRNNDPGVDGVFISQGTDYDTELPLAMSPNNYGVAFAYGFNNATVFPSLDILQCTGTYAYEHIGSYNFTIQRGEFSTPMLYWFTDFSIVKQCSKADVGSQGGVAGFDQILDNNDFVVFIDMFFTGC